MRSLFGDGRGPFEEIEKWAEENGGIEAVREAIATDRFGESKRKVAKEWLATKDAYAQGALDERAVRAAESQARSARKALAVSFVALAVAVVALLASIAALFKP